MVLQVQEEIRLDYQEIQGTLLCERLCLEETISQNTEIVFSSGPVVHSEFDVDFAVYCKFAESNYLLHKCLCSGRYYKWGSIIHWTSQGFHEWWRKCGVVIRLNKILYGQSEDSCIWYENLKNGFSDQFFVASKVDPCMFMSTTVICVVYVDDCLFWPRSQYYIDNLMKYFKEDGISYNW